VNDSFAAIEAEWDDETGFLGQVRNSKFDRQALARLLAALDAVQLEGESVGRELVRVLWYMPLFLEWNKERTVRVSEATEREYDDAATEIMNRLERLLGVP